MEYLNKSIVIKDHSSQGELFQEICDQLRVERTQTPAYNPKSNPVERSHRDLNSIIRALVQETNQDWEEVLPAALLALRTARNRHTGVTPFWALHGREARLPIDLVYPNHSERKEHKTIYGHDLIRRLQITYSYMREKIKMSIERARMNYKSTIHGERLAPEDLVFLHTPRFEVDKGRKFSSYWSGPWRIDKVISDVLFDISTHGDWNRRPLRVVASIDRLKRYKAKPWDLPQRQDLIHSDVALADEFLEQAVNDPDALPQFNADEDDSQRPQELLPTAPPRPPSSTRSVSP